VRAALRAASTGLGNVSAVAPRRHGTDVDGAGSGRPV